MPTLSTRPYRDSDLSAVLALFHDAVHVLGAARYDAAQRAAWAPARLDAAAWGARLAGQRVRVAEIDGALAGFIGWSDDGHIDLLFTAPAAARRGVAGALYAWAEGALIRAGAREAWTEASLVAQPLFARQGFAIEAEETVERGGVALRRYRMRKTLAHEPQRQPRLSGPTLRLRPMQADDFEALCAVASDPLIWVQHPDPLRWQRPVFERFFAAGLDSGGALMVETRDQRVVGSSRYYDWDAATRSIAIGFTFLARSHWGGTTNAELKQLMLEHIWRWADRVWFHVGAQNLRSRRAMEKIGGILDHIAPRAFPGGGPPQDYCYYRIDRPR